jgi:hypothetical protein
MVKLAIESNNLNPSTKDKRQEITFLDWQATFINSRSQQKIGTKRNMLHESKAKQSKEKSSKL